MLVDRQTHTDRQTHSLHYAVKTYRGRRSINLRVPLASLLRIM